MIAGKKVLWLFLLIAGLLGCLYPPVMSFAQEARVDLSLRILPGSYHKEVMPGEETTLFIEVRNNGDKELTNIRFESDKPEGWVVTFEPNSINYLGASSSLTVDVMVTPGRDTVEGRYDLTLIAEASETRRAITTTLLVKRDYWLWVGLGIAALVIIGFIVIFLRFGRH